MTQITNSTEQGLIFEIINAQIENDQKNGKKFVNYTLQVRFQQGNDEDFQPASIRRRYTQFLQLFTELKLKFPDKMDQITFPSKSLTGNFNNELITSRSVEFEEFLKKICKNSTLKSTKPMQEFLMQPEYEEAKKSIGNAHFDHAYEKFTKIFHLINKVFLDHHCAVLITLAWIVMCCCHPQCQQMSAAAAVKYAELTVYRFDSVSDADMLTLYRPLMQACGAIYEANGKSAHTVHAHLAKLHQHYPSIDNINIDNCGANNIEYLRDIIEKVEKKIDF